MEGLKIEDYMDVVYKCKFCPYTCTQSPEMSVHVKEQHLQTVQSSQTDSTNTQTHNSQSHTNSSSLAKALDAAVSAAVGNSSTPPVTSAASTASNYSLNNSLIGNSSNSNSYVNGGSSFSLQVSDDVLSFTSDSQAYLDKGLTSVSFAPLAVPAVSQSGPLTLSNTSTPDLTELINLVKPSEESGGTSGHLSTSAGGPLSLESVVQLQAAPSVQQLQPFSSDSGTAVASAELPNLNSSQSYTVMAIQLQGYNEGNSGGQPQYVVSSSEPAEPVNIPENAETKEFLLCGLCKLAFTSMEDCQTHMQSEHKELMQGTGVSIGVQVGGAKRGRKKKSEMQPKIKTEPFVDPDDLEWLPSVSEGTNTTHPDGRVRRRVKPPKALKDDYVLGTRPKKRQHKVAAALGYQIFCPMMSCKARFKTDEGLKVHVACHNLQDTAFTCKECQMPHEFWKHLRMHLWRHHQVDVDLLTCDVCNYKTDTPHKMSVHMEIHTDVKPYTCNLCGKGFRQSSQMKNHQVIHTSQEGRDASGHWFASKKCDVCDRLFANSKCLKKHKEAVHTNFKPFQCLYCNHTTARKAMMQLHLRTHTGEKPFKCDICAYTTGDHNSMRRHKMRHTGQKQYQCTLCPYTCIQSISLKQHMKHKHPGAAGGIFQCSRCPFRTINQTFYNNHIQDHKKGLIPDKIVPAKLDLPKARKVMARSHTNSHKHQAGVSGHTVMESLLVKHPQFHAVLPGDEPNTLTNISTNAPVGITPSNAGVQGEVFNMQVTMLPEGDTQVNAEDMARLSECPGLMRTGVSSLQLIYATLSTISEQSNAAQLGEGRSSLLTAELLGGIHTAVLSSMQDGVTVHSITYHLPGPDSKEGVVPHVKPEVNVDGKGEACGGENNGNSATVVVDEEDVESSLLTNVGEGGPAQTLKSDELFLVGSGEVIDVNKPVGDVEKISAPTLLEVGTGKVCTVVAESKMKMQGSSTLREMLEDKMAVVDNSNSEVSFIQMNFITDTDVESSAE
ncbi:uncharacterized protein LOC101845953 [Aplysia californica]|uniref:Uncharacterized protein LOC101845953 n=1 Tax=Aplysia californica TaxID=6500 RepID=A0ABM0K3A8_APLCA|nr:uncharacterized protein LOC101845953 [Aplysia californica]